MTLPTADHDDAHPEIRKQVAQGVYDGVQKLMEDPQVMQQFWGRGYNAFVQRAGDDSSQWIGKRILTLFLGAVLVASVVWMVKSGVLK